MHETTNAKWITLGSIRRKDAQSRPGYVIKLLERHASLSSQDKQFLLLDIELFSKIPGHWPKFWADMYKSAYFSLYFTPREPNSSCALNQHTFPDNFIPLK